MLLRNNQIDLSPYAYVGNNPVDKTDPDGNCPPRDVTPGKILLGGLALAGGTIAVAAPSAVGEVVAAPAAVVEIGGAVVIAGAVGLWGILTHHNQSNSDSNVQSTTGSVDNPHSTSRAARRDAQRKGGVPTSQPLHQDKKTNSEDEVLLDRDGDHTVQDAKKDPNTSDGLNRSGGKTNKPQMQNGTKGKSYYSPENK